jgi:hypothetical protein
MQRLLMNESELQILFNLLGDQLTVEYPLFDFDLLIAKPQGICYEFDTRGRKKEFDQSLSSYPEYVDELPEYHDYVDCMLSSGVVRYDNLNKFNHVFGQIQKWPDTKHACFCPDTNIFYHRFFSNFNKIKANEVVLIETIEEEIKAALSHKYDPQITDIFKALNATQKRYFDEIINRRTKNARRAAYLAQREFRKIKHGALEFLSGVDESKPDNDYNDAIIVKTACQAKQDRYEFLYLLTADAGVAHRCQDSQLSCFLFDVPLDSSLVQCSNHAFCELVYDLARVFGFIKLNSVVLFGEFRDKYLAKSDQIMVEIPNEKLFTEVEKHLKICRGLSALGIKE